MQILLLLLLLFFCLVHRVRMCVCMRNIRAVDIRCVVSTSADLKDDSYVILINAFPISFHLDTIRFHSLVLIPFCSLIYHAEMNETKKQVPITILCCRLNA